MISETANAIVCPDPEECINQEVPVKSNLLPPTKKPKFIRRIIDFFHHLGHHSQPEPFDGFVPSLDHGQSAGSLSHRSIEASSSLYHSSSNKPVAELNTHSKSSSRLHLRIFDRFSFSKHGSDSKANDSDEKEHQDIEDCELELIKSQLPDMNDVSELCFKKKYKISSKKIIGKGASGTVWLGYSLSHPEVVAIKEFRPQKKSESREKYLGKLLNEFGIARKLHHENVVRTIEIVHDGTKWYEIMEFCARGDMFNFIHHGGLRDMESIESCLKQLVFGVHYMHSQLVAHRDLKPENLLINERGILKITDFGISDSLTSYGDDTVLLSKGICGSSPYIAPEEFSGEPYDGRKVDVWSIGIIYYAMIFHGIPWEKATAKDPNFRHFVDCGPSHFEPFSRVQFGPRCLLRRMLEVDPLKRISIEEIIQDEWFKSIPTIPLVIEKDN